MKNRATVLTELLNEKHLIGSGVDVGVHRGIFSAQVLSLWPGHLFLVDAWRHLEDYTDIMNDLDVAHEENYYAAVRAVAPFKDRVTVLRMLSSEAVARILDGSLDWAYIDANHSYEAAREDIKLWWPKLKPGGLFSGHGYIDAVCEFAAGRDVNIVPSEWPSWWFFKE